MERFSDKTVAKAVYEQRFAGLVLADVDLQVYKTWDRTLTRNHRILVPIDVQAFDAQAPGGVCKRRLREEPARIGNETFAFEQPSHSYETPGPATQAPAQQVCPAGQPAPQVSFTHAPAEQICPAPQQTLEQATSTQLPTGTGGSPATPFWQVKPGAHTRVSQGLITQR